MSDSITFNFSCPACGGAITWPDDATAETPIICKPCDVRYGTYADLKVLAAKRAKQEVTEMFKKSFKGLKGWNVS